MIALCCHWKFRRNTPVSYNLFGVPLSGICHQVVVLIFPLNYRKWWWFFISVKIPNVLLQLCQIHFEFLFQLHRKDISNIAVKQPYKVYENSSKRNQRDKSYQKSISLDGVIENSNSQTKYRPKPLTIKCSNRTASCSSLSSISSCESSVSPSASSKSAWKPTWRSPGNINSWFKKSKDTVETLGCHSDQQYGSETDHPIKSYTQSRVGFSHATLNLVSSSLFSVDHKGKQATSEKSVNSENLTTVGQYTLFGPQKKNGGSILNSCAL